MDIWSGVGGIILPTTALDQKPVWRTTGFEGLVRGWHPGIMVRIRHPRVRQMWVRMPFLQPVSKKAMGTPLTSPGLGSLMC